MSRTATRTLGLFCVGFAVLCLGLWIPLDTDTGLIEKVRRRVAIGDALAPTLAAGFVLIGGALTALFARDTQAEDDPIPGAVLFGAKMLGVLVLGFVVALYAGPACVALYNLASGEALEYRLLRGSFPWKYIGFVLGGSVAIMGCIALAEGRVSGRVALISVLSILAMIALFDLPFDDLLLPPNGDY